MSVGIEITVTELSEFLPALSLVVLAYAPRGFSVWGYWLLARVSP